MITSFLSLVLLVICVVMLLMHFVDIKKSHKRNG